jgi:serine/threonine protein kinase
MPSEPRPKRPAAARKASADAGRTIGVGGGSGGVGVPPPRTTKAAETTPQSQRETPAHPPLGPPPAEPPVAVGGMKVIRLLGWGGMGWVMEVEEPMLRRRVAVKMMLPSVASNPVYRERFLREAQAQARVEHKYIVPIYSFHDDPASPYLVMPLLQGKSLERRMNERKAEGKTLRVAEAVQVAAKLATALEAVHESGLIHRDIKPSNVWLEGERARLLDFGVARVAEGDSDLTQVGDLIGTPKYMSPEQALGEPKLHPVDHRADLFSLGAVMYEMLTGRVPFPGDNVAQIVAAHHTHTPTPVRAYNPRVPPAVADLIHHLLATDPARRKPATAAEVLTRLKIIIAAGGQSVREQRAPAVPPPPAPLPPPTPSVTLAADQPVSNRAVEVRVPEQLREGKPRGGGRVRSALFFAVVILLVLGTMVGVVWAIAASRTP